MAKKKNYYILFMILIIFLIIMFSLFGVKNLKAGKNKAIIIIGDSSVWQYENSNWTNLTFKSSLQQLSWKKYNIYSNRNKLGNYYLWYNDKWYAFDKNKDSVDISDDMFAYSANFDLNIKNFEVQNTDIDDYISYVLESNDISSFDDFSSIYKFKIDVNGDNVDEDFYLISNAFSFNSDSAKTFSIAFMVKDNNIYYIYKDISDNKYFNGCKPFYNFFFDINSDGVLELVLSCSKFSDGGQTDMLYTYDDNGYKISFSN